jgi:membrane protein
LEGATEPVLASQLGFLFDVGIVTRDENGNWLLCRDLDTVSLLDLYRAGEYYLPLSESMEIPSKSEWDEAFFEAVSPHELKMQQSLKAMYTRAEA